MMSAQDLNIDEEDREALVKLLGMMDRNELVDVKKPYYANSDFIGPNGFCMRWGPNSLGGWVMRLQGKEPFPFEYKPRSPMNELYAYDPRAKIAEVSAMIRKFLDTGEVPARVELHGLERWD